MTIALTGARLIDGTDAPPREGMTVVVEGRSIAAVAPDGEAVVPEGAHRYDLAGRTLMPGLIDGHVHLLANAGTAQKDVHLWNVLTFIEEQTLHAAANARRALLAGVTTVRDMAGSRPEIAVKHAVDDGVIDGARVVVCGFVGMTGGHGDLFCPANIERRLWQTADGEDEYDYPQMIDGLRGALPALVHVIVVRAQRTHPHAHDYAQLTAAHDGASVAPLAVDPDSVKLLMYTSGTTGRAKAVRHSHNTMTRAFDNGREAWAIGAGDVMLMPSPVTHISGFANGIELPFLSEASAAFMERWDADRAIDFMVRVGATLCLSATPFLRELVNRAVARGETLPALRLFACGGASVPPGLIREAHRTLANCRAFRVYGSTEAPLVSCGFQAPEQEHLAAETDGLVFNWEARVLDEDGRELGVDCDGEIVVRGPAMMLGYADEQQTREAFTDDGFFRTGDVGHLTGDGAIVITDRKKDIIIRGGENLSAREIEDVLHTHAAILEAAAVAMPHERLGEGVCAFLVMRGGCTAPTLDELRAHLAASGLAKQKWPERIEVCHDLPKTSSGKVRKDVLRKRLREQATS